MSAPTSPQSPWLFGAAPDLLLGCGLGYAGVFVLLATLGPEMRSLIPFALGPLVLLVSGTPHYGATLLRVYEQREDRRAYAVFAVWASAVIAACFVAALFEPLVGSLMLTVMLTWSPWHYTGQNYGVALMFLRRAGVPISPGLKRAIYASFFLSFVLTFLAVHGVRPSGQYAPTGFGGSVYGFLTLGIPELWRNASFVVVGIGYLLSTAVAAVGLLRVARPGQLGPAAAITASQALWFVAPTVARHYAVLQGVDPLGVEHAAYAFLWVAVGHSVQYLWITTYYARRASGAPRTGTYLGKCLLAGAAIWTLPALLLAPGALGAVPYGLGLSALISSAVNLHHFVLDGAIWKLRDGRVARVLLRAREQAAAGAPLGPTGGLRLAPLVWIAGAVCVAVIVGATLDSEYGFRRALAAGDTAAAERSMARLAWMGRDGPELRQNLAFLRGAHGDLDGALREAERAIELYPTAESWRVKGWIHARRGELAESIAAYEQALAMRPGWAEVSNNLAWLRATSPDPFLRDPQQALALARASAQATGFGQAWALDTLAAAHAAALQFPAAVRVGERAVTLARADGDEALAEEIASRVALYRSGSDYSESWDQLAPPVDPESIEFRRRLELR
ncbi:MAG: hypothetical protein QNK03_14035 [Myxococcota bacterium]|nr:hypothetical protein [Myxococcota bacterium]